MKKVFLIYLIVCFASLQAQPPSKFYTHFGGIGDDIGNSVVQSFDGEYVVAGSTSSFGNGNTDVYLAKVDTMGWQVIWQKSYGGYNNDIGTSLIQLADSGFVITGYTNSFGSGGYDVMLVRTDKNGNLLWQKAYGGMDWDFGYGVKQTPDGGFVICGSTYSYGHGKSDGYIIKTDINGVFQWQKTYGGVEDDGFKAFTLTYNNLMAFAGATNSYGDLKGDAWLFKTDLVGDSITSFKYGNNYKQLLNDIKEHPISHNFYLCGAYDQIGKDSTSSYILGVDENGSFLFQDIFSYHERQDEQFLANAYSNNNNFIYIRRSNYSNTDKRLQPMVAMYSDNNYIAATKYGSIDDDELYCAVKTRDKGFVLVGYTKGFGASLADVFLLKLDSNSVFGATDVTSVKEISNTFDGYSVKVYPTIINDGFVFLENQTTTSKLYLSIQNYLGIQVFETTLTEKSSQIDLSILISGAYFISVQNKDVNKVFKIIKNN